MTKYSVISYNDGDNHTTRVDQISKILSDYAPDLFGLQETQEIHMPLYAAALPAYKYVYFDNDGTTYNSQPIFYRADKKNMYRTSPGYAILAENGFPATETFLPDAKLYGTIMGGTEAIDFCFVDQRYFKGVAYKVINDHEFSETASDHYPIYTEIERI